MISGKRMKQIAVCTASAVLIAVLAWEYQPVKDSGSSAEEQISALEKEAVTGDIQGEITEKSPEELLQEQVERHLSEMTLEEKTAQLFVVTPESITDVETVTAAGRATQQALEQYPVGGLVYLKANLQNESQTKEMLSNTRKYYQEITGIPIFLSVDEEGGTVARIGNNDGFSVEDVGKMSSVGETGDPSNGYAVGQTIGAYLAEQGFNLDFAPVADVLSNPENTVIGSRSFGSDSRLVSEMVLAEMDGLKDAGILSCVKHFPGHGGTVGDTHEGYAYTEKTLEELYACELVPFRSAVDADVPFIMVSHISVPQVTGDNTPSSLSEEIVTGLLREQLGYEGIVITDAMNMGAISENYNSSRAAVLALSAGCDMLLMPSDFEAALNGVLQAVEDGTLSEEQIDDSVRRILRVKLQM